MKRALMATVFGGLLIFAIPQAASGRPGSAHRLTTAEATAGEPGPGCATAAGADAKQDPPGEGKSHYDRRAHDDHNTF